MRCTICGTANPDNATFCIHCGSSLQKIFCATCGKELTPKETFCSACGTKKAYTKNSPQPLSPAYKAILQSASSRRLVNGILTLLLSLLQILWPFAAYYGDTGCLYSSAFEGIIFILLIPAFIFFLINFIGGSRCIVVAARMKYRPVNLLSEAHSGGSIMLIIFYSILLIISFFTMDVFGAATFIFGIIVSSLKLGIDIKFIRAHKKELTFIEENYLASLK